MKTLTVAHPAHHPVLERVTAAAAIVLYALFLLA